MPDGLSWRKCALLIVTSSHQGLCQSCFVAFSNPGASYFIKTLALWVFLLVPVGFSLVTHITLQGVQDAEKTLPFLKTTYCSLGKKLKMIPKGMKQNDLKCVPPPPFYDSPFSRTVWRLYGGAKGRVVWY